MLWVDCENSIKSQFDRIGEGLHLVDGGYQNKVCEELEKTKIRVLKQIRELFVGASSPPASWSAEGVLSEIKGSYVDARKGKINEEMKDDFRLKYYAALDLIGKERRGFKEIIALRSGRRKGK